jgi:hypothetical protein
MLPDIRRSSEPGANQHARELDTVIEAWPNRQLASLAMHRRSSLTFRSDAKAGEPSSG